MASVASSQQVLTTTELLEAILLHLSVKDLLFAQAVSVKWKAVVDRSHLLQKALFFEPATDQIAFYHQRAVKDATGGMTDELESADFFYLCHSDTVPLVKQFERMRPYHSHLTRSDPSNNYGKAAIAGDRVREKTQQVKTDLSQAITKTQVFLNPLLLSKFGFFNALFRKEALVAPPMAPSQPLRKRFARNQGGNINFRVRDNDKDRLFHDLRFARSDASWRRMLISQPPLGALCKESDTQNRIHAFNNLGYLHVGEPIRMNALIDFTRQTKLSGVRIEGHECCQVWKSGIDLRKIGKGVFTEVGDEEVSGLSRRRLKLLALPEGLVAKDKQPDDGQDGVSGCDQ